MPHLDALTIKSAAHAPSSRGIRLMALLASLTFPLGLIYAIYPYWSWSLITVAVVLAIGISPILSIVFLGLSLDSLRTPLDGGPETLADELRDIGVVPAPITIFTSLTVVLVALSTFSYYLYFLLRPNVPIWERQGAGSLMLYVNAVVSALEIISAATLIRHLNSVPESLTELSIGNYFYAPAYIGLMSAGISILGMVLMVAGPSSLRLPDSYEPTSKASDHPRRSTPDSANRQAQTNPGVPQAAGNQSLAALYQAQQQQRQQLIIQTKRKFMSAVLETDQRDQLPTSNPEMAKFGIINGTLTTNFDNGTIHWSKYDRSFICIQFIIFTAILFVINSPIQIVRFIRHLRWNSQDCTSLCYLDLITPFLGAPIFTVLLITLCGRTNLERKLWPRGPSSRALVVVYSFSTFVIYFTDLVLLAVKKPFDSDIFIHGLNYLFVAFMGVGLLIFGCVGVGWAKSLYGNDSNYGVGFIYNPRPGRVIVSKLTA